VVAAAVAGCFALVGVRIWYEERAATNSDAYQMGFEFGVADDDGIGELGCYGAAAGSAAAFAAIASEDEVAQHEEDFARGCMDGARAGNN
jgi:hypothetical protein